MTVTEHTREEERELHRRIYNADRPVYIQLYIHEEGWRCEAYTGGFRHGQGLGETIAEAIERALDALRRVYGAE